MNKKILLATINTNAAPLPGINSFGGGGIMHAGKFKMAYQYVSIKRDKIFDGSNEILNDRNLDATAEAHLLIL